MDDPGLFAQHPVKTAINHDSVIFTDALSRSGRGQGLERDEEGRPSGVRRRLGSPRGWRDRDRRPWWTVTMIEGPDGVKRFGFRVKVTATVALEATDAAVGHADARSN